jgi:anti-sigma factor RsiW
MTARPSDEMLTAYLDGELAAEDRATLEARLAADSAAAGRLAFLGHSNLAYAEAFARLLEKAPHEKLGAMLEDLSAPSARPAMHIRRALPAIGRRGLIAAAIGCLVAGVMADRAFLALRSSFFEDEDAALRSEVAEYLALYTADSLLHASSDVQERQSQLKFAAQRLGLPLDPAAMKLGDLDMRRAQILEYDGKPLGQILYLDPAHGPVALCIIAASSGARAIASERRSGLNVIYWSSPTHSFVIAARNPMEELVARAETVRAELIGGNKA